MESPMIEQFMALLASMKAFWEEASQLLPALLSAGVVLLAGWIVARLLRRGVLKLLKLLRADVLAEKAGIEGFLLQGGVRYTAVTIAANLIYWAVMFTVILAVFSSLGMQSAPALFNRVLLFIPNVITAVIVLMFGAFFAKIVRTIAFTYLSNIGISGADIIGHISQWAILLFVVSIALDQLAIGGQLLLSAFQIAFGALCLALAIAFGLGGRDWAARFLDRLLKH
jgi:hypothetical protein